MNWEAIQAIAELLSAVGVIVTLGYLAVQIRQNTAVVRTSSFQGLLASISNFTAAVSQNAEVAEIYLSGLADYESLSSTDKIRFHTLVSDIFTAVQLGYQLQNRGLIDRQLYSDLWANTFILLQSPGMRQWWDNSNFWWHEDFRAYVDAKLREAAA